MESGSRMVHNGEMTEPVNGFTVDETEGGVSDRVIVESIVDDEDDGTAGDCGDLIEDILSGGGTFAVSRASDKAMAAKRSSVRIEEISDDLEDETLEERLAGLLEIFPERLLHGVSETIRKTSSATRTAASFVNQALWTVSTTFAVLVAPVIFQQELNSISEQYSHDVRQMMLGPAAAAVSSANSAIIPKR